MRQVIVLPLLYAAGFDIWDPLEVAPEETNSVGGRADLSIKLDGQTSFVLELKRLGAPISDKETEQTVNYANSKAIRWSVATNGRSWKVYDTYIVSKPSSERGVLEIELLQNNTEDFAEDLFDLLARERWLKDEVISHIEAIRVRQLARLERAETIGRVLPRLEEVWEQYRIEDSSTGRARALDILQMMGELSEEQKRVVLEYRSTGNTFELRDPPETVPLLFTGRESSAAKESTSAAPRSSRREILHCRGRGAHATARLLEDGALEIQPGSTSTAEPTPGFDRPDAWRQDRDELLRSGVLKPDGDGLLVFAKPQRYRTPSGAAVIVLGRSANGKTTWITEGGKTYAQITSLSG